MRKLILFIGVALMVSCAPGKKSEITYIDYYCDSCKVRIQNEWFEKETKTHIIEVPFEGIIVGYKRIEVYRFDSPNTCLRPGELANYSADTSWTYVIDNGDTTSIFDSGGAGFCY